MLNFFRKLVNHGKDKKAEKKEISKVTTQPKDDKKNKNKFLSLFSSKKKEEKSKGKITTSVASNIVPITDSSVKKEKSVEAQSIDNSFQDEQNFSEDLSSSKEDAFWGSDHEDNESNHSMDNPEPEDEQSSVDARGQLIYKQTHWSKDSPETMEFRYESLDDVKSHARSVKKELSSAVSFNDEIAEKASLMQQRNGRKPLVLSAEGQDKYGFGNRLPQSVYKDDQGKDLPASERMKILRELQNGERKLSIR